MRRGQPTVFFGFVVLVGLARALAYAGTGAGRSLSPAALAHYVALQVLAFAFAALLLAALSKATASRAAQVALYAQAVLFLAPFVDLALGAPIALYEDTYVGLFGGSLGALLAGVAYGAVLAWGVWDATLGAGSARATAAAVAGITGIVGLSFLAVPWPRPLVLTDVPWGVHLALAVYFGALACLLLALAVAFSNRAVHRQFWRRPEAWWLPVLLVLPIAGVVASGRLGFPQILAEPFPGPQIVAPYLIGAPAVGGLLWSQRRIARMGGSPIHTEVARLVKLVALLAALFLGPVAFLAAAVAASLVWMERDRANPYVLAGIAGLAVVVGDATVAAVDVLEGSLSTVTLTLAIYQWTMPSLAGILVAVVAAVLVARAARVTIRTSG